ncbi:hypothetical protein C8R45DRAFT_1028239 [Mycena sanguinolenta]|nr:hypothetical protein C8R45DRAFT_1028239 [Mycena sanguinolenta]
MWRLIRLELVLTVLSRAQASFTCFTSSGSPFKRSPLFGLSSSVDTDYCASSTLLYVVLWMQSPIFPTNVRSTLEILNYAVAIMSHEDSALAIIDVLRIEPLTSPRQDGSDNSYYCDNNFADRTVLLYTDA